jgi:hypothetical protein
MVFAVSAPVVLLVETLLALDAYAPACPRFALQCRVHGEDPSLLSHVWFHKSKIMESFGFHRTVVAEYGQNSPNGVIGCTGDDVHLDDNLERNNSSS